jgi:hypothetical protein
VAGRAGVPSDNYISPLTTSRFPHEKGRREVS